MCPWQKLLRPLREIFLAFWREICGLPEYAQKEPELVADRKGIEYRLHGFTVLETNEPVKTSKLWSLVGF